MDEVMDKKITSSNSNIKNIPNSRQETYCMAKCQQSDGAVKFGNRQACCSLVGLAVYVCTTDTVTRVCMVSLIKLMN